jgi:hypothetical protein
VRRAPAGALRWNFALAACALAGAAGLALILWPQPRVQTAVPARAVHSGTLTPAAPSEAEMPPAEPISGRLTYTLTPRESK